ncbi:DUF2750 domain-containing protein [Hyphomicrobium methylovorum]|uniref:DUF2750 domain-containing protein n=1 Tax=Hyphomicrobium methylovorum TaxID=84 RepID=UPI001FE92B9B|nr:DUF2750 domain-containing protein [Hyphomicrobium methylovorum]
MPRIPELAQRDRFVRRAVSEGRVLTLADEENASVPSQKVSGRTVQLFWSSPIEAGRWAEALAGNKDLQDIPLTAFAADILPGIATAKGFAGTDWVSDPIEAEVDPIDLQIRLKLESLPGYAKAARGRGEVYLLANDEGPLLTPASAKSGPTDSLLHVFASRSEADRHMKRLGGNRVLAEPVVDFVGTTLPWATTQARAVTVEPIAGAGFIEVKIADFGRQLAAATAPAG